MKRKKTKKSSKKIQNLSHTKAKRKNIPTSQHQPFMTEDQQKPIQKTYPRPGSDYSPALREALQKRNPDLDPQLVWRGKETEGPSELTAKAPPIYCQEKIHPQAIIDDLRRQTSQTQSQNQPQKDLFADFNGLPSANVRTEFYQHKANWQNRMILGDSLQVMASLCEREGLSGKAQTIYFDLPYGIKFNSNFQWSTTSRAVKDGDPNHIPREPEQVQAFRDTWRHGIHSYLAYIRNRLTIARELLNETGSIFLQIGDANVHRLRCAYSTKPSATKTSSHSSPSQKPRRCGASCCQEDATTSFGMPKTSSKLNTAN